jgi:YceI-like domain/FAD binding domain
MPSPGATHQVLGLHALAGTFSTPAEIVEHHDGLASCTMGTFEATKWDDWLVGEEYVGCVARFTCRRKDGSARDAKSTQCGLRPPMSSTTSLCSSKTARLRPASSTRNEGLVSSLAVNPARDAKIHGPEVLDVERYATIDFRSTGLRRLDADHYQVDGPLTLHGVTKEITLEMTYKGAIVDTWGQRRLGVTAEAVLSRDDFGSGEWGRVPLLGGGFIVPSRVAVTMDIEATLDGDVVFGSLRGAQVPEQLRSELTRIASQTWPSPWGEALRYGFEQRLVFGTPVAEYLPERLTVGRIALAGDAAHAASPMVGGGFREGLHDASQLARVLGSDDDLNASLAAYESARLALVVQHVRRSQQASRSYLAWAKPA